MTANKTHGDVIDVESVVTECREAQPGKTCTVQMPPRRIVVIQPPITQTQKATMLMASVIAKVALEILQRR